MLKNLGIIERIALAGARYIKANGGRADVSVGVMRFALQLWISLLLIFILSSVIGLMLGILKDTLLTLLVIGLLRYFSGGWHFKSLGLCIVFTTMIAVAIPLVPQINEQYLLVMNYISLVLVLLFAPTGHGQNFKSVTQKRIFKWVSVTMVCTNFLFLSQISTISLMCQTCTLFTIKGGEGS